MNRIKNQYYTILDFPLVDNETVRLSLGIIGFLFVLRQSPSRICYIPSRFRQTLHTKCKLDLTQFLIDNGYLQLYQRPIKQVDPDDEMYIISKSGKRFSYGDLKRGFKKIPYLYIPTIKLTKLRQIKLRDEAMTRWIDKHLHLLNDQYFNHYNHSYKYIKIENVPSSFSFNDRYFKKGVISDYGHPDVKEYHIDNCGYDLNNWAGNHVNVFTSNNELLKYTNLKKPIEIGLLYSECLIMADQLLKTIGPNDFSAFYLKTRFNKLTYKKDEKGRKVLIAKHKGPLFTLASEYSLYNHLLPEQVWMTLYRYDQVNEFAQMFPQTWDLLYRIKAGQDDKGIHFMGFTKNITPTIFKTDYRLNILEDSDAYRRGQKYYKITLLVYHLRIVGMMREIWNRLKKCGIKFIPLESSVVVSSNDAVPTEYIVKKTIERHIDNRLVTVVLKRKIV